MITNLNDINIFINSEKADIFSAEDLNLRFNNQFADLAKISTISTEYSFSFNLPITKNNQKIFDFANILSKRGKFNKKYKANVTINGLMIFDGELILTNVSKEDGFKCNLYINKLNTVDEIFGESTLNQINNWRIPYNQQETINEVNNIADLKYPENDVFFPLVSYGMFQKNATPNNTYTSKYLIDKYNRFYNENFYPSVNLLKLVKKCFETKGYNVDGDVFDDKILQHIYTSVNLSDEQDPIYNYGDPNMGKFAMKFNFKNYEIQRKTSSTPGGGTSTFIAYHSATSVEKSLDVPHFGVGLSNEVYNWDKINIYDVWSTDDEILLSKEFITPNNILWRENRLVAPCNGFYKIKITLPFEIDQTEKFNRYAYRRTNNKEYERYTISSASTWTFDEFFTEFQLIKNDNTGLNLNLICPDAIDKVTIETYNKFSAFPHEKKEANTLSSETDKYPYGYIPKRKKNLNYDTRVNKNFIMGCCADGPYLYTSVIKNGKSWDSACADTAQSRTDSAAYYGIAINQSETPSDNPDFGGGRGDTWQKVIVDTANDETPYGVNTLPGISGQMGIETNSESGATSCLATVFAIVYLEKNDYLQLKMATRQVMNKKQIDKDENSGNFENQRGFNQSDAKIVVSGATIEFECFSPNDISINSDYMNWNNPSRFPTDLDLSQFLSDEETMADFINNFISEFNLSYSQNGKTITLNKQKIDFNRKNTIDLTNRISQDEIESEYIDYPSKMSIKYSINDEERGFYISAEQNATDDQLQSNTWKDYADVGYDEIKFTEDEFSNESTETIKTSYNWYEKFNFENKDENGETVIKTLSLPIIAKDEWMIDGYRDAEYMKEDGYGLKRRYWFPGERTNVYVILNNDENRKAYIRLCSNVYDNVDLSYKLPFLHKDFKQETLLTKFFNVFYSNDSNLINFECYLTANEYLAIKNGSNILIDNDVYIVTNLEGYDPSGNNKTKITALKK